MTQGNIAITRGIKHPPVFKKQGELTPEEKPYLDKKKAEDFVLNYYFRQLERNKELALEMFNKVIPLDAAGLVHSAHIKGREDGIKAQLAKVHRDRPELIDCPECKGEKRISKEKGMDAVGDVYVEIINCPNCDGTGKIKHRDRPDREKIAKRISKSIEQREWGCLTRKVQLDYLEIADQIQTLIPDEKGYYQRYIEELVFQHNNELKGAKKHEGERIFKEIEERLFTYDGDGNLILRSAMNRDRIVKWWQALKDGR